MTYLVDANVLCEPTKSAPDPRVIEWLERNERDLTVDPVILGEVRFGILLLPAGQRRRGLERWFDEVARRIRCFSWDTETGCAGRSYWRISALSDARCHSRIASSPPLRLCMD